MTLSGARFVELYSKRGPWGAIRHNVRNTPAWARCLYGVALAMVQHDPFVLQSLDESFRSDRQIVITAVRSDSSVFQYASKDLRGDEDMVLLGYLTSPQLRGESPTLLSNKTFVFTLVQRVGLALQHRCRPTGRWSWRQGMVSVTGLQVLNCDTTRRLCGAEQDNSVV